MELDARELFRCTWLQLPWWKIVRCFKSGLHCTRLYIAFKAQKLLEVSEVFWSFACIFKSKIFMYANTSHKKRRAKYQTEMLLRIAKQLFRYKKCFQRNNTLTVDTNDQKFNCYHAKGHSQTGNQKKKMSASWIRKTNRKKKSNEKRLETLFTHRRSNIYLHKLPFIVDLTDIKSDCFQVQLVN